MSYSITRTVYKVSDFISWQRAHTLVLSPSFQRRSVWPAAAKSYLIDTVARGLPMPIVFLREQTNLETLEPIREVVDGQQRLRTLLTYIEPESLKDVDPDRDLFVVKRTHNAELAGKTFRQLPLDVRRRILSYEFSVHVLPSDTDDREILQIFARMNSTGIKLNFQELRNAEFYGEFKKLAYDLAYEQLSRWRTWKLFKENDIARMVEVEETSDLIIVIMDGVHGKDPALINNVYRRYEDDFPQAQEIARRFRTMMDAIDRTLGARMSTSVYSRRSMFHTLFTFYYDIIFGLKSPLEKARPRDLPADAVTAALHVSDQIQHGQIDEELAKVLRGATSHSSSRQLRLDFMQGAMRGASQ